MVELHAACRDLSTVLQLFSVCLSALSCSANTGNIAWSHAFNNSVSKFPSHIYKSQLELRRFIRDSFVSESKFRDSSSAWASNSEVILVQPTKLAGLLNKNFEFFS